MKKFLLKTLLLSLPIAVLAISMEYLLRQVPNDYSYKNNYLNKHSKEIELLILGSSHAYYGINPVYFSQKTFNAGQVSQTLDYDWEIFKNYRDNFKNLKTIVLPISYFTLWEKLEYAESLRVKFYVLYYGIKAKSIYDYSELLNNRTEALHRLANYYIKHKDGINCDGLGWGADYKYEDAKNLEETGKTAALRHSYDINSEENKKVFAENINTLNNFIEFCNKNNVKLMLITLPAHHAYRKHLNAGQLNKMAETLENFNAKYNNVEYINHLGDSNFTTQDFFDADHLNEFGAKKFSVKLAKEIDFN